jgi:hypothetical protein
LYAGRQILNGTFTHPSPIAGLVYTGSPANRPLRLLVEQRDGVTLFGRPLSELSAEAFNELADRLLVSAVVALDEDQGRLDFVARNPAFTGPRRLGPFLLWSSQDPRPLPEAAGAQRWRISTSTRSGSWLSTGMAYSPLWRCLAGGRALLTRRSDLGLLEIRIPPGEHETIDLEHRPGAAEWSGLALSVFSLAALVIVGHPLWRRSR